MVYIALYQVCASFSCVVDGQVCCSRLAGKFSPCSPKLAIMPTFCLQIDVPLCLEASCLMCQKDRVDAFQVSSLIPIPRPPSYHRHFFLFPSCFPVRRPISPPPQRKIPAFRKLSLRKTAQGNEWLQQNTCFRKPTHRKQQRNATSASSDLKVFKVRRVRSFFSMKRLRYISF